jgi:hypothetical protein
LREVTFKHFAALAKKRGHTPESLVARVKGKIEQPAEFFHRVMDPKHGDKVIPYRSLIEFCGQVKPPAKQMNETPALVDVASKYSTGENGPR